MTPAEQRRADEEALLFGLLQLLARDTAARLQSLVDSYLAGDVSIYALSQSIVAALTDSHAHAAYLGRRLAGKRDPFGPNDQMFGVSVAAGQQQYLSGLLVALQTDDYGTAKHLARRLGMYALRLRGTAHEAWMMSLPADTLLLWMLGMPETHHCLTCPERAAHGPYAVSEVTFQPGDKTSDCGVFCYCNWQIVGGGFGFPPLSL